VRAFTLVTLFSLVSASAATLDPNTSDAWDEYIQSATERMQQRLAAGNSFLWVDEAPERLARVKAGEVVVAPIGSHIPKKVPSGLIHDWVGAVFIPNASINDALQVVRDYSRYKDLYQPSVVDSKVIDSSADTDRYFMLLMNKALLLKTAFSADYEACYVRVDDRRAYSIARSTRIQEIQDYGTSTERLMPEGQGRGILWRLFAVTRYMERDGGLYIEFEAIGLSRNIPVSVRWFVEPMVRRVSRSSLATSLEETEHAVRTRAEVARSGSALSYKP
jgi:hypothetical protein